MPLKDEDENENYKFRHPDDDVPDEGDSPDDQERIRCAACKKWILEDFPKCPYCGAWQADRGTRKSLLFRATAIVCIIMACLWTLYMCQGYVP